MDIAKGYAGVTLEWLYDTIEQRARDALLNSHKTFIAARKIQNLFRDWYSRLMIQKKNDAAIIIQKYCRGWLARKKYYKLLKDIFLERLICYYNRMATRIQAYWRGYYSRSHIHDHTKLRKAQEEAAKELVICIAHRLHYMLRTRIIPGVYSIRNTHCLSKVERLLASMKFTNYNTEVRKLDEEQINLIQKSIENTDNKLGVVRVPYIDGTEACKSIGGNKMTEMLDKYHLDAKKEDALINKKTCVPGYGKDSEINEKTDKNKKNEKNDKRNKKHGKKHKKKKSSKNFCADIVNSMTNWGIIKDDKQFIVCPGVLEKPENIVGFVGDVESIIEKKELE